jgi:phage-related protein
MHWSAHQFGSVWDVVYDSCDRDTREVLDRRLDILLEHGNNCGRPITAHLDDGIFELRAKSARMLFYFGTNRDIIFAHCIIKKTKKVPREDIETAKKNRAKIKLHGLQTNDLAN